MPRNAGTVVGQNVSIDTLVKQPPRDTHKPNSKNFSKKPKKISKRKGFGNRNMSTTRVY